MNKTFIEGQWIIKVWKDGDVDFVLFDKYFFAEKENEVNHFKYKSLYRFRKDVLVLQKSDGTLILDDDYNAEVQWKKANKKEEEKYQRLMVESLKRVRGVPVK